MANFTPELIEKARTAESAEALLALARSNNMELTEEEAASCFEQLHPKSGELSDDELDMVAGGGCGGDSGKGGSAISYPSLPIGGTLSIRPKSGCPKCGSYCFVVFSADGVNWRAGCVDCPSGDIYGETGSGSDALWAKYDPA